MAILEVKDLSVEFATSAGVVQAVRGISFSLEKGRTLAVVGESGSGKSVTGRAIMGILAENAKVSAGSVLFDGKDLLQLSERQLCPIRGNRIAMVFQDPLSSLDPVMRIGRQITEVMCFKLGLSQKAAKEKALGLLREVGIRNPEKCFYQFPHQLSGGMRQRIVIAIALAADPEILICDEPTTALDVTIQAQILELLARLKQQRSLSMLFITHDFGVVANVADEIAVMYAGKIVEYGTSREIFYDPRHPYTKALLAAMPDLSTEGPLYAIPGSPPDMTSPPPGDAFAPRNPKAMVIDHLRQSPPFWVTDTHWAATWLLHPDAPREGGEAHG
jgi:oligopeptide/dipeptide ABC transporter ATP-binding protein